MAEYIAIYRKLVASRVRSQLQYPLNFATDALVSVVAPLMDFLAIMILFAHLPSMGGFRIEEVAFLYGMTCIAFALVDLAIGHLDQFSQMIRRGDLDVFLVRPLGSLFQLLSADFALRRVGKAAQGLAVLAYGIAAIDIVWTPAKIAMIPLTLLCAVVIFGSVWVVVISIAIWIVDATEIANAFTYGGNFLTQYPLTIFGRWVRRLLAYVVPMAFIVYFPSLFILGKPDPLGMPSWLRFAAPAVAVATFLVARFQWGFAIRRYRSTGS